MIHIHARTPDGVAVLRGRGLPRDHRGDPGRGRRRHHQLLDRRDRRAGGEADRLPARAAARRRRAEHGLDELREVLAPARGLRVQGGVRELVRHDHRAAAPRCARRGIRPEHECFDSGHLANLDPLLDMGAARAAAAGLLRHGRHRRHPADRAQPRPHGRAGARGRGARVGRDRRSRASSGRSSPRRSRSAATCASGSRTTSTCPTARWRAPTATSSRGRGAMAEDVGRRVATVAEARERLGVPRRAPRHERRARGHPRARPLAAAAGRLLHAAAGRLRRRRAQGRGHRAGRLRPLGAAALRGRRAERRLRAVPLAQPRQALDPRSNLKTEAGREVLLRAGARGRRAGRGLPPRRDGPPRRRLRAPARGEPRARLLRDHRLRPGRARTATARATT